MSNNIVRRRQWPSLAQYFEEVSFIGVYRECGHSYSEAGEEEYGECSAEAEDAEDVPEDE